MGRQTAAHTGEHTQETGYSCEEALAVLLWGTLSPLCLYSPLSFFSFFLSNASVLGEQLLVSKPASG